LAVRSEWGTRLNCPICGVELEVLSLSSCDLGYADVEELEEEWDDDEWDEHWEDED